MKSVVHQILAASVFLVLNIPGQIDAQDSVNHQQKKESNMSVVERNKEVVRNLYEQALNKRKFELLGKFVSEDFTGPNGKKGPKVFKDRVIPLIDALPDVKWDIQEIIGGDDKVMIRWKLSGTHTGTFLNIAPTGQAVLNDGIGIFELKDGKIVEARVQTDRLGFLQTLGIVPPDLLSPGADNAQKEQVIFIDKFTVPQKAKEEFVSRMNDNREFIKNLPGFIRDQAYEQTDEEGNLVIVTLAVWQNEQALNKAKEAVQDEYKRINFNPPEFMERLNIKMERGTYRELVD